MVAELIDRFLDEAPRQLASIERSLDAGDTEGAARTAAELSGMSAALGADQVAEAARVLEHALRAGARSTSELPIGPTREAVGDLTDSLRDARSQGWPDG